MGRICNGNAYQNSYVTCAIARFLSYTVILSRKRQYVPKKQKKDQTPFVHITLKEKDPAYAGPNIICPQSSLL